MRWRRPVACRYCYCLFGSSLSTVQLLQLSPASSHATTSLAVPIATTTMSMSGAQSGASSAAFSRNRNDRRRSFFTYSFASSSSTLSSGRGDEKKVQLYVPLTARSNARTLPETRGPNFLLQPDVVAALCRVRDAESELEDLDKEDTKTKRKQWEPWCRWLDTQEHPQKLPDPLEPVAALCLPEFSGSENGEDAENGRRPSVSELVEEIAPQLLGDSETVVVIAGEGEPLLRYGAVLQLARRLKENQGATALSVRVTTNGLLLHPQPGSTTDPERESQTKTCFPQLLRDNGVDAVSVALMTHDPVQYRELMNPHLSGGEEDDVMTAHDRVCQFLETALKVDGLQVEATAVDRPDVDKSKTEELAASLGLSSGSFRWRTYFP